MPAVKRLFTRFGGYELTARRPQHFSSESNLADLQSQVYQDRSAGSRENETKSRLDEFDEPT